MENYNLLERWRKEVQWYSSELFPTGPIYNRTRVDFIYAQLIDFFGERQFVIKVKNDTKMYDFLWVKTLLLRPKDRGCFEALHDICLLIEYSKSLPENIQIEMKRLRRDPYLLRCFFFELFIFKQLDANNVPNKKKVTLPETNQEIEGICSLSNRNFLFECRKMFLPNLDELDILYRVMEDFARVIKQFNTVPSMLCVVKLNRDGGIKGSQINSFKKKFRSLLQLLKDKPFGDLETQISEEEFGYFRIGAYDEASHIEAIEINKCDIAFALRPPASKDKTIVQHRSGDLRMHFNVSQSTIDKKLESALKEKVNQHKKSSLRDKIIFLGTERIRELQMGIFSVENMYKPKTIEKLYRKLDLDCIVCLVEVDYTVFPCKQLVSIFSPNHYKEEVNILHSIFST